MIIRTQDDKNKALNRISLLVLEKPWQIDIKPYKKNRTLAQNNLMWLWLTCIGSEIGYTENEMYDIMVDKFLPDETIEYGGKQIKKNKSTSRLKVKEFTVFLEHVDRWAVSEMGIILPCPADIYFEAMGIRKST
jgi:hypothetical protein